MSDISQINKLRDHWSSSPVACWDPAGRLQSPQQLFRTANTYYGPHPIPNTTLYGGYCENRSFQMRQDLRNTTVLPADEHPYEFSDFTSYADYPTRGFLELAFPQRGLCMDMLAHEQNREHHDGYSTQGSEDSITTSSCVPANPYAAHPHSLDYQHSLHARTVPQAYISPESALSHALGTKPTTEQNVTSEAMVVQNNPPPAVEQALQRVPSSFELLSRPSSQPALSPQAYIEYPSQRVSTHDHYSSPSSFQMNLRPARSCSLCGTPDTPVWRHHPTNGSILCNACGIEASNRSLQRHEGVPRTGSKRCSNCSARNTPAWRKGEAGRVVCNACGLYLKDHGVNKPVTLRGPSWDNPSTRKSRRKRERSWESGSG